MSVTCYVAGHKAYYDFKTELWYYFHNGKETAQNKLKCANCDKSEVEIEIYNNDHTKSKKIIVDHCIAPLIQMMNKAGAKTLHSCCGHGKEEGNIILWDGHKISLGIKNESNG